MGTARHKHDSKRRVKIRMPLKIDHHEVQILPGRRILSEEFSKWEIDGNRFCGYARELCEYQGEIIGLCSLYSRFKQCPHEKYILRRHVEDCPKVYRLDERTREKAMREELISQE